MLGGIVYIGTNNNLKLINVKSANLVNAFYLEQNNNINIGNLSIISMNDSFLISLKDNKVQMINVFVE